MEGQGRWQCGRVFISLSLIGSWILLKVLRRIVGVVISGSLPSVGAMEHLSQELSQFRWFASKTHTLINRNFKTLLPRSFQSFFRPGLSWYVAFGQGYDALATCNMYPVDKELLICLSCGKHKRFHSLIEFSPKLQATSSLALQFRDAKWSLPT